MALELFYTSVPKGLKPGTAGFCTVALTSGMTTPMIQRLESLSGYLPVFRLGTPNASKNPPAFAHWRVNIGGRNHSVLSHVCFAGADYSGRSNKFAHHVVLDSSEQASAGPAWVMMQPDVMELKWSGEIGNLSPNTKSIPDGDNPLRVCEAWADATKDPGWAGVLADTFLRDASRPAYVIYEPGTDLLALLNEAIALLPLAQRWRVTFSTYFTTLPAGLSCSWRCCMAGTKAAEAAPANATSGVLIDLRLRSQLGLAPESKYVSMARSGEGSVAPPSLDPGEGIIEPPPRSLEPITLGAEQATRPRDRKEKQPQPPMRLIEDPPTDLGNLFEEQEDSVFSIEEGQSLSGARRRSGVLLAVAIVWPILVLVGGWLIFQNLGGKADLTATHLELAEANERLSGENDDQKRLIEQQEAKIGSLEKDSRRATANATKFRKERDNALTGWEKAEKRAQEFERKLETSTSPGKPQEPPMAKSKPKDASERERASGPAPIPGAEVPCQEGLLAVNFPRLEKDALGNIKALPPAINLLDELPDDAQEVKFLLPVEKDTIKPFQISSENGLVYIKYSKTDGSGNSKSMVIAETLVKRNSLFWEWKAKSKYPIRRNLGLLNNLISHSVLEVGNGQRDAQRIQLRKPQTKKLSLEKGNPSVELKYWNECKLYLVLCGEKEAGWRSDKFTDGPEGGKVHLASRRAPVAVDLALEYLSDERASISISLSNDIRSKGRDKQNRNIGEELEFWQRQINDLKNDESGRSDDLKKIREEIHDVNAKFTNDKDIASVEKDIAQSQLKIEDIESQSGITELRKKVKRLKYSLFGVRGRDGKVRRSDVDYARKRHAEDYKEYTDLEESLGIKEKNSGLQDSWEKLYALQDRRAKLRESFNGELEGLERDQKETDAKLKSIRISRKTLEDQVEDIGKLSDLSVQVIVKDSGAVLANIKIVN